MQSRSAISSGPMPAGSPALTAIVGSSRIRARAASIRCGQPGDDDSGRIAEELDFDVGHCADRVGAVGRFDNVGLQEAVERPRRPSEHPELLERLRRIDLAGVLDRVTHRQGISFAAEDGELIERRLVAQHALAGKALPRDEVVPRAWRQRDFDLASGLEDRGDEQRVAAHELRLVTARERVAGKGECHRPHHGHPGRDRVRDHSLQVRNQTIAKREPLPGDGFGLGAERPGLALADAVDADVRAEHRRLQPAEIELRRRLLRAVEAADVGAVIRHSAHAPRETAADRCGKAFPVALRIAAPLDRIALAPDPAGAAPDHRRRIALALVFRRRLEHALVVEERIDVVQPAARVAVECDGVVGHLLAEIALDHVDAVGEERRVRIAPPHVGAGMREIDDAALGQRRQHLAERARAPAPYPNRTRRVRRPSWSGGSRATPSRRRATNAPTRRDIPRRKSAGGGP